VKKLIVTSFGVLLAISLSPRMVHSAVLSNVEPGGWLELELAGGKWDDQNVNNSGPFPNVAAGLAGAGLPSDGLVKIMKIDAPAPSGSANGITFSVTGQGGTSGTWTLNRGDLFLGDGTALAYFSLKAAQNWNLWQVMADIDSNPNTYTNAWDTNASGGGLLTPNRRNFAGLSHITFWAVDAALIPEPSALSLVVIGACCRVILPKRRRD
jgi:hypothetical protein